MPKLKDGLVSVSIVTWNSCETLPGCVNSLKNQTYEKIEVVVVDNGSDDNSVGLVQNIFPDANIVRNSTNFGFCRAQNSGISASNGEFFMPLNPDVQTSPTFIENLVRAMSKNTEIGIVAGKFWLPETDPQTGFQLLDGAGLFVDKARRQYLRGHGEPDRGQYDTGCYVFGACGAAPLYRRTMLEDIQIGGEYFDNSFFAHKEDLDLSWRAQLLGWRVWYEPSAVAYHDRSFRPARRRLMSREVKIHAVKNRYLTMVKNDLVGDLMRHILSIVMYDLKILAFICMFERSSLVAFSRFVHLLPDVLHKRRTIMQRRRASDQYMQEFFR